MKFILGCLLAVFSSFIIFLAGYVLGAVAERYQIAEAIRTGRLTVEQRVDHIADQILSQQYKAVGDP